VGAKIEDQLPSQSWSRQWCVFENSKERWVVEIFFLATGFAWSAVGAGWDVATRRIPNTITYSGILAGLSLRTALLGWHGLSTALLGVLIGGGVFFLLFILRAMGGGDVKLMAAVGSITGPSHMIEIIIVCALAGGVMALITMIYRKRAIRTVRNVGELLFFRLAHGPLVHPTLNIDNPESIRLPYGLAIAAGAFYPFVNLLFSR